MNKMLEACIRVVLQSAQPYSINASSAEIQVVTQKDIWVGADRSLVQRGLEAVLFSSIEVMNLQRFTMPTEFLAATIVVAVYPVNWKLACIYMSDYTGTELEVLAGYASARERVTPDKLFALCMLCEAQYELVNRVIVNELNLARNIEEVEDGKITKTAAKK